MSVMTKRRGIALFLLLAWVLLATGPLAYAATGKCCVQNMCPMKKSAHASTMTCHDRMTQQSRQVRPVTCGSELDGLVFSFLATLPGNVPLSFSVASGHSHFDNNFVVLYMVRKLIPPPKLSFA